MTRASRAAEGPLSPVVHRSARLSAQMLHAGESWLVQFGWRNSISISRPSGPMHFKTD